MPILSVLGSIFSNSQDNASFPFGNHIKTGLFRGKRYFMCHIYVWAIFFWFDRKRCFMEYHVFFFFSVKKKKISVEKKSNDTPCRFFYMRKFLLFSFFTVMATVSQCSSIFLLLIQILLQCISLFFDSPWNGKTLFVAEFNSKYKFVQAFSFFFYLLSQFSFCLTIASCIYVIKFHLDLHEREVSLRENFHRCEIPCLTCEMFFYLRFFCKKEIFLRVFRGMIWKHFLY